MKWLGALVAAGCLAWAGSAGATAYVVDVTTTPTLYFNPAHPQDEAALGSADFAPITLHVGDSLEVEVNFTQPLEAPQFSGVGVSFGPYSGPFMFNYGHDQLIEGPCDEDEYTDQDGVNGCARISGSTTAGSVSVPFSSISYGIGAVPEPSTWITMIIGLGISGLMLRRRRSSFA